MRSISRDQLREEQPPPFLLFHISPRNMVWRNLFVQICCCNSFVTIIPKDLYKDCKVKEPLRQCLEKQLLLDGKVLEIPRDARSWTLFHQFPKAIELFCYRDYMHIAPEHIHIYTCIYYMHIAWIMKGELEGLGDKDAQRRHIVHMETYKLSI